MDSYISELTLFLNKLLKDNPHLIELQKENRKTSGWDSPESLSVTRENKESKVPLAPYYYFEVPKKIKLKDSV